MQEIMREMRESQALITAVIWYWFKQQKNQLQSKNGENSAKLCKFDYFNTACKSIFDLHPYLRFKLLPHATKILVYKNYAEVGIWWEFAVHDKNGPITFKMFYYTVKFLFDLCFRKYFENASNTRVLRIFITTKSKKI